MNLLGGPEAAAECVEDLSVGARGSSNLYVIDREKVSTYDE